MRICGIPICPPPFIASPRSLPLDKSPTKELHRAAFRGDRWIRARAINVQERLADFQEISEEGGIRNSGLINGGMNADTIVGAWEKRKSTMRVMPRTGCINII